MKNLIIALLLLGTLLFQAQVMAHGGEDPVEELKKRDRAITHAQSEFATSQNDAEKLKLLDTQINALNHKVLVLRNLMAKDYPHVKEGMSKYKLDYMESVDESLIQTRALLRQLEQIIEQ